MTIDLIRSKPQGFDFYLSIYRPNTLLQATVNDSSITRGARSIVIDSVTPVTVTNRTVLVGTSAGGDDLGRVRVRSMDATHLYVAENSHVQWQDNAYLTVIDYVDVQPIYPRIIQDPSDAEKTIFYKDYDVVYSNQNSVLGAFPCAGSHRAANIDPDTGYVDLYWTATGSYHLAGASMSYSWTFGGAASGTSDVQAPGMVRYDTPGFYTTALTVAGSNGSSDTTYRYVSIHSPDNNPTLPRWNISNLRGSRGEGGWTTEVQLFLNDLDYELVGGELVVLFSDDRFQGQKAHVEFNSTQPADGIKLVGYVLGGSVRYDYKSNTVSFTVGTVSELMKVAENFVISVENSASPTKWYELYNLDGKKSLYHYLRWHSTVLDTVDFRYVGKDYQIQFFDTEKTTLFDALNAFFSKTYLGQIVSNKRSQLWAETLPEADQVPTGRSESLFTLDYADYLGEPSIERRMFNTVSFIDLGGIAYLGPEYEDSVPLLSAAPGISPAYSGKGTTQTGLALISQDQLNWVSGNLYAKQNARFAALNFRMNGYCGMDIVPISSIQASLSAQDTGLIADVSAELMVMDIDRELNFANGSIVDTVLFNEIIDGIPGETVPVIQQPDLEFSFNPRPFTVPPFNFSIPLPSTPTASDTYVVLHPIDKGLWWTDEYDQADPRWWSMNFGLSGTTQLNYFLVDIALDGSVWTLNNSELRNGPIGGGLSLIMDYHEIAKTNLSYPTTEYAWRLVGGMPSPFVADEYVLIVGIYYLGVLLTRADIYTVSKYTRVATQRVQLTKSFYLDRAYISYGDNKFVITGQIDFLETVGVQHVDAALTTVTYYADVRKSIFNFWHKRSGRTSKVFYGIEYSSEFGELGTWTAFGNSGTVNASYQDIDSSPDGVRFMKIVAQDEIDFAAGALLRSSDGGLFWGTTPNIPTGTFTDLIVRGPVYNMGTDDEWIIATKGDVSTSRKGYVLTTDDFGETWYDITGNLRDFIGDYFLPLRVKVFR